MIDGSTRRILVIGSAGAGKSTMALRLGEILDLPVIHLDSLFWLPGWERVSGEEWIRIVEREANRETWIMDGNYGGTLDHRLQRCDTVIFLDVSRWLCLWRVIRRRIRYAGRSRPDMNQGCPEKIDMEFMRWIWNFPKRNVPPIRQRLAQLEGKRIVHLRSQRDVARYLDRVGVRSISTADHSP